MREIVQYHTADCDLFDVEHAGGLGQMLKRGVVGVERQGNEGLEAAGFILQGAQLQQMVDPIFVSFDVTIQHRRI